MKLDSLKKLYLEDQSVIDAGLIGAAQRVEHYEIASYRTVWTFTNLLGEEDAAERLAANARRGRPDG
jgi:ferritin-like metal-binding protein YciE